LPFCFLPTGGEMTFFKNQPDARDEENITAVQPWGHGKAKRSCDAVARCTKTWEGWCRHHREGPQPGGNAWRVRNRKVVDVEG
jgi:hypothetical protein